MTGFRSRAPDRAAGRHRRQLSHLSPLAGPTAVAAVVKADAYGLGAARVAPALAGAGCDSFFVARLEEGVALRPLLPRRASLCWMAPAPDAVPALISHRLTPVLN